MGVFSRIRSKAENDPAAQFVGGTIPQAYARAKEGNTRGAIRAALGQDTVDMTLEGLGLKKNKADEAKRRAQEEEQKRINAAAGETAQRGSERANEAFNKAQQGRISTYQTGRDQVFNDIKNQSKDLELQKKGLLSEADAQATDARNVYQNLSTKFDKISSDAEREAGDAMTLKQYMDPANSQAFQNVNNLYQNQAQGEGRAGLADFGVLSSLGAQAMGAGMAGMGPLTAGQQMGMLANSQRQAGEAYANTQRRMQALRDQGLQTGLAFHGKAYEAGLNAKDRFRNALMDREGLTQRDVALQQGLRGERGGFQDQISAQQARRSGLDLGRLQENYGLESGFGRDTLARENALRASRLGLSDKEFGKNMGTILRGDQSAANEVAQNQQLAQAGVSIAGSMFTGGGSLAAMPKMDGGGNANGTAVAPSVWGGQQGGAGGMAGAAPANPQFNSGLGLGVQQLPPQQNYSMAGAGYPYSLQNRMAG